jgi:NAD(P)-dependent dehydrogenase (short-subunit alcohol dehydrogenase family)
MWQTLSGREIVLAGGAGGLGRVAAGLLAAEGAHVISSYRKHAVVGGVQADLSSAGDRKRLLDAAPELYGLVVFTGEAARSEELLEQSLASNFVGPIRLAREAAQRMKDSETNGAIVLIATMQATAVFEGSTAYAAPKAALVHAGRILAKEMRGPANIRVNVVCPGVNDAGMAQASIASGKYDRFLRDAVIPRWGRAEDVARAVRFFLEPDNYVTGQVLTVDAGLTL